MIIAPGKKRANLGRNAVTACHLAVSLPVFILLTFASIGASAVLFVARALCVAGCEGVRLAIQEVAAKTTILIRP